jgi:hypothetical protein
VGWSAAAGVGVSDGKKENNHKKAEDQVDGNGNKNGIIE